MRRWFGAFLILSLASCGEKLGHEVDLSQLKWTVVCQSGRVQPCSAEVPGHVLPSLVNAGLAPNPYHGTHERDVQWVEDETWTYSTKLPPTHMAGMDSAVLTFQGLDTRSIDYVEVRGACEIPLKAKILALTNSYAAICCGGLVVDGGIYRHEFVAHAVIDGLMQVQLETGIPVFSGVLTPQDFLADGQPAFFKTHFVTKGQELATACFETLKT